LQFGCARITSAICGSVNLILVVGFIGLGLRNSFSDSSLIQPTASLADQVFGCWSLRTPLRDLSVRARDLFERAKHLI
jgi:hypothetical protein